MLKDGVIFELTKHKNVKKKNVSYAITDHLLFPKNLQSNYF